MKRITTLMAGLCIAFSGSAFADWRYSESIDPMTDEDRSIAALSQGRNDFIAVRCDGNSGFDILVGVGDYLGSTGGRDVTYRLDKDKPISAGNWATDTEGKIVFVPDDRKDSLLNSMKTRSDITVQVTDFQGSKPYSKFSLAGSTAAIEQLNCI